MELTKKMIDDKLKQIALFEAKFGKCTESRAMYKFCTNKKYRENVRAFNKASIETIKNYLRYV
tara:strand:+ start:437 stop:625 length:189 start_codon:yes stop_codon:yes gene_type:complete